MAPPNTHLGDTVTSSIFLPRRARGMPRAQAHHRAAVNAINKFLFNDRRCLVFFFSPLMIICVYVFILSRTRIYVETSGCPTIMYVR